MLGRMPVPEFRIPSYRDIERLAFEGRVSMEELCRRAAVNSSTFRYWKSGRSTPSVATVQALLDAGLAAVATAERAEAKAAPAKRRPRAKAKAKAAPAALRRLARRSG
jgi:transcriptional regulator with XRE-family HTH domain